MATFSARLASKSGRRYSLLLKYIKPAHCIVALSYISDAVQIACYAYNVIL